MGFRTLEISHDAEIHIKEGQFEVLTEDGNGWIVYQKWCIVQQNGKNQRKYMKNWLKGVILMDIQDGTMILIGKPSDILLKYGVANKPIYMTQSVARK